MDERPATGSVREPGRWTVALSRGGPTSPRGPAGAPTIAFAPATSFDARDLVQVKYEMLRRVQVERAPVARAVRRLAAHLLSSAGGLRRGRPAGAGAAQTGAAERAQADARGDQVRLPLPVPRARGANLMRIRPLPPAHARRSSRPEKFRAVPFFQSGGTCRIIRKNQHENLYLF